MNNSGKILALRYAVCALFLLLLYTLQTTPRLLVIGGVKPLLVIPAAIAIAMHEGEFAGGIFGAAAGLLCDAAAATLFGFNGLFICLFSIVAGLLIIYLMRCNLLNCLLFTLVTLLARGSVEFLFAYGMWGHENVWKLYLYYTLPAVIYTLVLTAPLYWLIRRLHRRFDAARN